MRFKLSACTCHEQKQKKNRCMAVFFQLVNLKISCHDEKGTDKKIKVPR